MADAKKCDRCKKLYDPYSIDKRNIARFRNPAFFDENGTKNNKVSFYLISGGADATIDLCPECTEDFELFMEGYELGVRSLTAEFKSVKELVPPAEGYIYRHSKSK